MRKQHIGLPTNAAVSAAEDVVARLDERLATSPIADACRCRANFLDAAAALSLEGELVALEDLVLHDGAADIRAPTNALTKAHTALRARRRIAASPPGWATTSDGLDALRGLPARSVVQHTPDPLAVEEDAFAAELAALDAIIARTTRVLAQRLAEPVDTPLRTLRKDRLAAWLDRISIANDEPPVLAAAHAGAALDELVPFENQVWLGRLLVADLLRGNGKTRHHLAALSLGLGLATRERRFARDEAGRTALWIAAIEASARSGLAEHDRLSNAYHRLQHKLVGRRSTSKLPKLIELVMCSPLVSSQTISKELAVTPRAAQDLVAELGLRELTGRSRYRCWGLL